MSTAAVHSMLEPHRRYVWGLCYRMTGSAAEAEDLVQDTFVKALTNPPSDLQRTLRPWLTRVAMNLSRDALRRRKTRSYVGPWLPSPVELEEQEPASFEASLGLMGSTEGRYELMESVSFAFLFAIEALKPQQRAVLLLRDVFDYSVADTAEALDLQPGNVKVILHRARAKMKAYDTNRQPASPGLTEQTKQALGRLLMALASQDHEALNGLISEQVTEYSDGGGEFLAALRPIVGRDKVIRFFIGLLQRRQPSTAEVRLLNGRPALMLTFDAGRPREATRAALLLDIDTQGRIVQLYNVVSPTKLAALRF